MKEIFYVYAGYYEVYISKNEKLTAPFGYQGEFNSLEEAIAFCDEELPSASIVFCENTRDDYYDLFCQLEDEDFFFNDRVYFAE